MLPSIDEDYLDSTLGNAFFGHPDFEYNRCDPSFLIDYEVFLEESVGLV